MTKEICIRTFLVCPICGESELRRYFKRRLFVWVADLQCGNGACPYAYNSITGYGLTPEMAEESALKKLESIAKVVERISAEGEKK